MDVYQVLVKLLNCRVTGSFTRLEQGVPLCIFTERNHICVKKANFGNDTKRPLNRAVNSW